VNGAALDATVDRAAELLGRLASRDVPVGALTTYRVGGRAALFAEPGSDAELEVVGQAVAGTGVDVLVLGNGSNLLVGESGFPGLVVHLAGDFAGFAADEEALRVDAGGALAYPVLARRTAALGLAGLEWAVGIPGSVGGAARMNAGGHGADTAAVLVTARITDLATGSMRHVDVGDMAFGYRRSAIGPAEVVVAATFAVERGEAGVCEARISEIVRWRRANQPGGQNAGSVFTNPPDDSAGRIIEAAGLKGLRIGSAEVSPKHANFIQVDSGGAAGDVVRLVAEVRRLVADRTGVELVPELRVVGASL
jgi:UDP-N-acetylmuramate dehydrogenase